jgi:hypothetical protein
LTLRVIAKSPSLSEESAITNESTFSGPLRTCLGTTLKLIFKSE